MAVNTGTDTAVIDGYSLEPGEALDYTFLRPDVMWDSPITINLTTSGSRIRMTRLYYKEVK